MSDLHALICRVDSGDKPPQALKGWVGLVASERGLRFLGLPRPSYDAALQYLREHYPDATLSDDDPFLQDIACQVQAYAAGQRREFTVKLDLQGHSRFAVAVWALVGHIPYGQTRTYGWVAKQIGESPADAHAGHGNAQAVGAALAANPIPLIVPCHRVVGSDGTLHGFAGGLDMKAALLAMESGQAGFALDQPA